MIEGWNVGSKEENKDGKNQQMAWWKEGSKDVWKEGKSYVRIEKKKLLEWKEWRHRHFRGLHRVNAHANSLEHQPIEIFHRKCSSAFMIFSQFNSLPAVFKAVLHIAKCIQNHFDRTSRNTEYNEKSDCPLSPGCFFFSRLIYFLFFNSFWHKI